MVRSRLRRGVTLAEMVTVLGIVVVLLTFAARTYTYYLDKVTEAELRQALKVTRAAQERAYMDTGVYVNPWDLDSPTPPGGGWKGNGRNGLQMGWGYYGIRPGTWKGPYLDRDPVDPTTGGGFCWTSGHNTAALYSCNSQVSTEGNPYSAW
jgi:prepilin-type N-terminal cleavage/methylation domain-containing protein